MFHGLPDFQHPVMLAKGPVWPAFETTRWLAPPTGIDLATTPQGLPAFRLSLTRPMAPFMPPPPYAVLDLMLSGSRDTEAAFAAVRERNPRATMAPLHPSAGSARLEPASGAPLPPTDVTKPAELIWNGLGKARLNLRFGPDAAGLVGKMVEEGTLPLTASMAVGFDGVSPRLTEEVRFDPAELLASLASLTAMDDLTLTRLASVLTATGADLPIERRRAPTGPPAAGFGEAMADRIAARFGSFERGMAGVEPTLRLTPSDRIGSGSFVWDLSEPFRARRWLEFQLDPFAAVRAFIEEHGPSRLLTRNSATPIPTGTHVVSVFANLPPRRVGLQALGVTVRAAPAPPNRPHAAVATVMIEEPEDAASMTLKLSPGETLAFISRAFAVIADRLGVRRLEGPERHTEGSLLRLLPEDFGILPLTLEAAPDILAEAWLEGDVRYRHADRDHAQTFVLDIERPALALGLPAEAENGVLNVTARSLHGAGPLSLGPLPARHTRFELMSFAEFGPQIVLVRCRVPLDSGIFALELIADDRPDSEIETLAFTEAEPQREWRYFARSPFRGGYRWRPRADHGSPPHPWRHQGSAADPLDVDAATLDDSA